MNNVIAHVLYNLKKKAEEKNSHVSICAINGAFSKMKSK